MGQRGWTSCYAVLWDGHLLLGPALVEGSKSTSQQTLPKRTSVDKGNAVDVAHMLSTATECLVVRHGVAEPEESYKKRDHVFRLSTAAGSIYLLACTSSKEAAEWVAAINEVAATESAAPLPAPVGAARSFQRPTLPHGRSRDSLSDQHLRFVERLKRVQQDRSFLEATDPATPLSKVRHP